MKVDIKNTKEVLSLVRIISLTVIDEIKKDGFQPTDLVSFVKSPQFLAELIPAVEGIELVKDELKDLDWTEGYDLAKDLITFGREIISKLKA